MNLIPMKINIADEDVSPQIQRANKRTLCLQLKIFDAPFSLDFVTLVHTVTVLENDNRHIDPIKRTKSYLSADHF